MKNEINSKVAAEMAIYASKRTPMITWEAYRKEVLERKKE